MFVVLPRACLCSLGFKRRQESAQGPKRATSNFPHITCKLTADERCAISRWARKIISSLEKVRMNIYLRIKTDQTVSKTL